jgi:hypothetical protein
MTDQLQRTALAACPSPTEQRRASARAALAEMKIDQESLDFLVEQIGDRMMQEVVRRWTASDMGIPTVLELMILADTIHLQIAVADLDQ